jgi:hypothetical protein
MRTFLIKIVCFGVGFLVFDKILIPIRNHSPKLEVDKRLEQIVVGQIDADSRGARSVAAYQIEESLNRSCYNLSYPGSHILFHEYLLREVLGHRKNTKPSTIVLVVDDADVFKEAVSLDFRLDRLYPLVKYPSIRSELVRRGQKRWGFNEILVSHQINRSFLFMEQKQFSERDFILPCGSMLLDHQKPGLDFQYDDTPNSYGRRIDAQSGSVRWIRIFVPGESARSGGCDHAQFQTRNRWFQGTIGAATQWVWDRVRV